jgi:Protein of unknown function (DUF2934)
MKTPTSKAPPRRRARVHDLAGPVPRLDAREAAEPVSIIGRSAAFMEPIDGHRRQAMIAEAAYYRAERRHFDPGHELDDWLEAERAVERLLQAGDGRLTGLV